MPPVLTSWLVVLLSSAAVLGNVLVGANPHIARAAIAFSLLYHAATFGGKLARRKDGIGPFFLGLATLLSAQSVIQVIWYYAGGMLGAWSDAVSLSLALIGVQLGLTFRSSQSPDPDHEPAKPSWPWIALTMIPALVAFGFILRAASLGATSDSIRTPWTLLPPGTIAALALIPLTAWLAAWKAKSRLVVASLIGLSIASIALIAPLVYTVGFGFDGFLHIASEQIIADTGTLEPKPFYYLGQYTFVTWLARITNLPLPAIDRFLVPIFAALLPLLLLLTPKTEPRGWRDVALLLFLPLSAFIATTPQSFAYVLGLAALLCAIESAERRPHPLVPLLFAAWSLTVHPLAGLPFALATLALLFSHFHIAWLFALAAGAAIPASFFLMSAGTSTPISWDFSKLLDAGTWWTSLTTLTPPRNRVALWADWTAMVTFLTWPLALIAAVLAVWKDIEHRTRWTLLLTSAIACTLGGLIMRTAGDFAFLIDYERSNYADRLFLVALFLLLPAAAACLGRFLSRIEKAPALTAATLFIGLAAWHGAQAYAALPRHDAANVSRGWSVGQSDIEAVRWIDQDAQGQPYTVLANQSVSAAAIREFGFKRYAGDNFYYPIPTGGPLYQTYLEAVGDEPSLEPIREAAQLGQSKLVYVVLNAYWWNADRVGGNLSALASKESSSTDGRVRIFKFELSP